MIISLTGFMGCGKSSVGRELATLLGCSAVDLDEVIERQSGRKIHQIFETEGEEGFRRLELEALRDVLVTGGRTIGGSKVNGYDGENYDKTVGSENCKTQNNVELILSLGGGTLTTPECTELVHEKTTCIYLRAGIDSLVENLEADGVANRPMLSGTRSQKGEHSPIGTGQSPHQDNPQQNETKINLIALRNRIEELMNARKDSYEKTAHHIIDIDGETPRETALKIATILR